MAALLGVTGFMSFTDLRINSALCNEFSCFFAGQFVWFAVTPICAYLIGEYYFITHKPASENNNNNNASSSSLDDTITTTVAE